MPQALMRAMADVMERVIGQDPAPCMQVNGLAPGYIDTDLTASLVAERAMAGSVGPELMAAAAAAVRRDPPGLEVSRSPGAAGAGAPQVPGPKCPAAGPGGSARRDPVPGSRGRRRADGAGRLCHRRGAPSAVPKRSRLQPYRPHTLSFGSRLRADTAHRRAPGLIWSGVVPAHVGTPIRSVIWDSTGGLG
jgi:hypothetical protein